MKTLEVRKTVNKIKNLRTGFTSRFNRTGEKNQWTGSKFRKKFTAWKKG